MSSQQGIPRYVMIGGFLGAGKTTAIEHFARILSARGLRVGLITNDQSSGLVDTAFLRSRGFAVEEIAGGCFCCRFDSLRSAAQRLTRESRPEVFLAEPVGSCTDLLATVSYPLRRIYGDRFDIAPLSVLVDPQRAARILGLAQGRSFSPKVVYVYRKQLEEAQLIVVNKCDALCEDLRPRLVSELERQFPEAEVLCMSAREGSGVTAWMARVLAGQTPTGADLELDYDRYADGEACLGWLNATYAVEAARPFDANELLLRLTHGLRQRISAARGEIAHLKMVLDARGPAGQLSLVSLVSNDAQPDLRESLADQVCAADLILNLRAELAPEDLSALVAQVFAAEAGGQQGISLHCQHQEHFRPARPRPTHRLAAPGAARATEGAAP